MTAQNTMANAIEATKRGAYDYLTKPFDLEEVGLLVDRALALRRLTRDLQRLPRRARAAPRARDRPHAGHAGGLQDHRPRRRDRRDGAHPGRHRHRQGARREDAPLPLGPSGPFVALNCSAIPNELLESELFGYERGAVHRRERAAHRQVRGRRRRHALPGRDRRAAARPPGEALRVLQEREFSRVGGREAIRADARIVAATNQDLEPRSRPAASARTSTSA
jgi:DNA-binding NtrC family response regulator